jgi:hypothetical protein
MRIIESRSIDNQAGLLGSRLITGTSTIEGAFQSFIVAEDTIVSKVYNSIGIDVTQKLGLTSVTLKAGAFISMAKGDCFSSIKLTSGSVVAYFVSHGGMTITADAYLNEFLARTGSSYLEAAECAKATLQGLINIGLLQKASLVMSPSMYEEDLVKSVVPQDGSGDLSFTRASDGTRINSAGLVEVCPWNLNTNSEIFTTNWGTDGTSTATNNNTTAPNGTLTAAKVVANSANGYAYKSLPVPSGTYTLSYYVKASASTTINIALNDIGGSGYKRSSAFSIGTEWQRIEFSETISNGSNLYIIYDNMQTGKDYFIWGAQLNIGSTAKPYFPTTDRLNVPRLTYQNGGGGCPSLLLEPQRTNIFPNSQTTANWSFTNMSRTANYGISPDGTQNADLLSPTTSGSVTFQSDITTSSLVIGQPFVVSFFIKLNASFTSDAGTNILDIRLSGPTVWSRPTVRVNLETGEVTSINNAIYISSTNFGNGWFRITFGATPTGTSGQVALQSPTSVTMNGGSFYIWGLQGEANATYATSYIPSQASSATRVADACFKTGISSLIGQTEGVLFWEGIVLQQTDIVAINRSTANGIYINKGAGNLFRAAIYYSSNVIQFADTIVRDTNTKIAIAYKSGDSALFINGAKIGSTNTSSITFNGALSEIRLNDNYLIETAPQFSNNIAVYKQRLTDAECISLTTI